MWPPATKQAFCVKSIFSWNYMWYPISWPPCSPSHLLLHTCSVVTPTIGGYATCGSTLLHMASIHSMLLFSWSSWIALSIVFGTVHLVCTHKWISGNPEFGKIFPIKVAQSGKKRGISLLEHRPIPDIDRNMVIQRLAQSHLRVNCDLMFLIFKKLINLEQVDFSKIKYLTMENIWNYDYEKNIARETWHTPLAPPQLGPIRSQDWPRKYPNFFPQARAYILSSSLTQKSWELAQPIPIANTPQFSICQYIPSVW